jgi:hypothetical protein
MKSGVLVLVISALVTVAGFAGSASASSAFPGANGRGAPSRPPKPDLRVKSISASPASVAPGEKLTVIETTADVGRTGAARSTTAYYFSVDARRDAGDWRLGSRAVPKLKAGKQSSKKLKLVVPTTQKPGRFRVVACADQRRRVRESTERDNCRVARGRVTVEGPVISASHPRIYLNATNKARLRGLLSAGDATAVRFRDMVDGALAGSNPFNYQAWYSALVGQLTSDPKYCADAIARVDAWVASEEALIGAGMRPEVAADSYLDVGPRIGDVSLTLDWCYDSLTAVQRTRWIAYANQAVWNVWNHEQAVWGGVAYPWSGFSVDSPSKGYYYSFLKATLLLGLASEGENPDAYAWIDKFRLEKFDEQLVPTFSSDLVGGGSPEGTGNGIDMRGLFWLYDVWEASTGERIADLTPHTRASLAYLMHETVPTLDRIAPIGDQARDPTASLFDYHREYGAALAWLYRSDELAKPMRTWLADISVPQMSQPFEYVYDFLYRDPGAPTQPLSTLRTTYFASGTGDLFARSAWDEHATWVGFKMGPYADDHAHRDQLSFLIYKDNWLAYDANIESQSGIHQDEAAHNLVRIDKGGSTLTQREGTASDVLALADNPSFTYAAADASDVYGSSSGVVLAQREIIYLKPDVLVVYDRVDAGNNANYVWQLNSPLLPTVASNTATFGGANGLVLRAQKPVGATFSTLSLPATDSDYNGGYRLQRSQSASGAVQFLNVLSVDSAVTSVSDASQAGDDGVAIALANGGTATVRFHPGTPGGTLSLSGAAGTFDGPLPSGVTLPGLFAP